MLCNILHFLFGNGTRPVQTFNICINTIWVILLTLHITGSFIIDFPVTLENHIGFILIISLLVQLIAIIGFVSKGYKHQLMKASALLFSALLQTIIASGYVTAYPPFELEVLVNTSFALWFSLAVLYIIKVEGLKDGTGIKH